MKYENMSVGEYLMNCYTKDYGIINETDMYNYIKYSTGQFDKFSFQYLLNDIRDFIYKIEFYLRLTDDDSIADENLSKNPVTLCCQDLSVSEKYKKLYSIEFEEDETFEERMFKLLTFEPSVIIKNGKRLAKMYMFSNIAEKQFNRLFEIKKENKLKSLKTLLTFSELFRNEYITKIDDFKKVLQHGNFIDKNNFWNETSVLNEPAKLYKWLIDKGVLNARIKATPAMKCFYKEFGIIVCEKLSISMPEFREVTIRNLTDTNYDYTDELQFNSLFSSFLIK